MTAIRTHYDNLQIKRTASIEVIKAAYKGLTQRYHPDRNPDDRERCERVMKLINRAYEVLSDPDRRAEYDAFVAREEAAADEQQQKVASAEPTQRAGTTASNAAQTNSRQTSEEEVLKRAWQEVYAKFPYVDSAGELRDDAAIAALLELMRQYMADGRTTASALRLASGLVGREFDLINEAEGRLGRPPLAYGFWNVSQNKSAGKVAAALLAKYPFLDASSQSADKIAVAAFKGLQDKYRKEGLSTGAACHRAGEEVGSRFSLLHQERANAAAPPPPPEVSSPQGAGRWYAVPLVILGASLLLFLGPFYNPLDPDAGFKAFVAVTGGLVALFWLASGFVNSQRSRATPANNSSSQKAKSAAPSSGSTVSTSTDQPGIWKKIGEVLGGLVVGGYWIVRIASSKMDVYVLFLLFAFIVAIGCTWIGFQTLRRKQLTAENRKEAAILLSIALAIVQTACALFSVKANQMLSQHAGLVITGAALEFFASFFPMYVAVGSLVNAPPILRLRQPLMWRAAFLILLISMIIEISSLPLIAPTIFSDPDLAKLSAPAWAGVFAVTTVTFIGLVLAVSGLVLAIAGVFARAFDVRIANRAAWAVIVFSVFGLSWTAFAALNPKPVPMTSTASVLPPTATATNSASPAVKAPGSESSNASSSPATAASPTETRRLMDEHAAQWYRLYPFLDNKSPQANETAIYAVLGLRDRLIRDGQDPVSAMDEAIRETGPKFAQSGTTRNASGAKQ